jgi:hypothetical protein
MTACPRSLPGPGIDEPLDYLAAIDDMDAEADVEIVASAWGWMPPAPIEPSPSGFLTRAVVSGLVRLFGTEGARQRLLALLDDG